jgi:hypothetical protein
MDSECRQDYRKSRSEKNACICEMGGSKRQDQQTEQPRPYRETEDLKLLGKGVELQTREKQLACRPAGEERE